MRAIQSCMSNHNMFDLSLILLLIVVTTLCLSSILIYSFQHISLFGLVYAQNITADTNTSTNNNDHIPTTESAYQTQSIRLPSSVGTFVWYIVDQAHENTVHSHGSTLVITIQYLFRLI